VIILVDLARLSAYRQLLALPTDPTIAGRFGHHITAPASPPPHLDALKEKFVRHLMYSQLRRNGDL
jgi:hypothetical protein